MASTPLPDQQEQPEQVLYPQANPRSSGSVGPFLAVISVLAVITVLSCVLGRFFSRRIGNPVRINYRDSCWWVRRRFCCCVSDELQLGVKPTIGKSNDIETPSLPASI
ncbi:hypothetical protein ACHQM5_006884 [Ranunculus cassubicifolius]